MPRIKKRLQRKQPVKRVVKRKTQPKQPIKQTSEQKAKEIEMMKAMLMARPTLQTGQGPTQQNDKVQQQIDTLNKRLIEQTNATESSSGPLYSSKS